MAVEVLDIYNSRFVPKTPFGECLPRRKLNLDIWSLAQDGLTKSVWVKVFNQILLSRGFLCTMRPSLQRLLMDGGQMIWDILDNKYSDWVTTKPEAKLSVDQIIAGARPRDWLAPPTEGHKDHHPEAYCRALKRFSPDSLRWIRWRFDKTAHAVGQDRAAEALLRGNVVFQPHQFLLSPIIQEIYGRNGTCWDVGEILPG